MKPHYLRTDRQHPRWTTLMRIAKAGFTLAAGHRAIRGFGLGRVGHSGTDWSRATSHWEASAKNFAIVTLPAQSSRSRRERSQCACRKSEKGAAFLHHRNWDDFWHNLNLKNRWLSLLKRDVSKMKVFGTPFGDCNMPALSAADATAVQTFRQIMQTSGSVLLLMLAIWASHTPSPDVRTWDDYYPVVLTSATPSCSGPCITALC